MADERFSHISKDPRFRAVPVKERKVKIDQRFQTMFKDERFNYKYRLDKRGRPFRSSTSENLRRYYDLSDDSTDESDEDETLPDNTKVKQKISKQKNEVAANKLKSKKGIPDNSEVLEKMKNSNLNDKQKSPVLVESEKERKSSHLKEPSKKDIKEESDDDDDADHGDEDDSDDAEEDDADHDDEDDSDDAEEDDDDDDDDDQDESGLENGQDLARGIGNESSSSDDSDFDSLDEKAGAENIIHDWGEMDKDAVLASESSSRLAICNMDWENITAADLFIVLNSFKPPQGAVLSVKIYPSEFGLKRMEEENRKGPIELAEIVKDLSDDENNDSEAKEGNTFHNEKLRQYEITRMKYYYSVVECDCEDTANYLYNELDGSEYEQSRTSFDMRFIPADMEFTETARDVCTEMPSKDQYKPNQFVNNAMSASTVSLSWDETNRHRVELTTQTFSKKQDVIMDDFKAYLASSSDDTENEGLDAIGSDSDDHSGKSDSENEEGREAKMNKYKKLLEAATENMKKKRGNVEMEITWEPGLKEKTEGLLKQRSKKQTTTPWLDYLDKVKTKRKEKKSARKAAAKKETSEEKTLFSDDDMPSDVDLNDPYFSSELKTDSNKKSKTQKKKEKKKKKLAEDSTENLTEQEIELKKQEKEELALLMADDNDNEEKSKHHFDFEDYIEGKKVDKKKKSKKKKLKQQKSKTDDDFKIDVNDKRFEAVFTSGHYNIDKSAPDYKKSAGMEELIEEKLRRRYNERTQTPTKRKNSSGISGSSENYSQMNATNSHSTGEQSLDSLVRSIKSKVSNLHNSKKKKIK
ncbi:ESF1 homolog isoform X2 [Octopus sinensis]|uniref:ESF1 homolog isoform X2 n=1 Tax=Octopus sinensis TaxID=2607531 RepID=A0A7E6F7T4_9MOLL|nr:ESF1 homolog isoform X2 [Octopus sinensis]